MNLVKSIVSFVTRLSSRERIIFYATIFMVGLFFLDRLIVSPIFMKINELDESIRYQEEAIEQSLIIITQEKRIDAEKKIYNPYLSEIQSEEKEITSFLQEVETSAKQSTVYLVDIKPSGKNIDGDTLKYFVKINFEAQMEQVFNFFYNISNSEKLLKVEGFEIGPKSEGSSIVACSASISKALIPK